MIRLIMGITLSECGGSQRVVYDLAANLPESLYDVTVMTCPGGELLDWIHELNKTRENKIKVIAARCFKREISLLHDAAAFFFVLKTLRRLKPDIAHFHNSKMGILGRLAAKLAGVPRVYYTVHGWGLNPKTTGRLYGAMSLLERAVSRLGTEVVFVSESDRETGIKNRWASPSASRLIYNGIGESRAGGVYLREELGIPDGIPVLVFVARLADPKDPVFAIRVSACLSMSGLEHRLLMVGDGPKRGECESLVRELGLGGRVMLLGQRDDVRSLLAEADIFCLFTKWEGLPISVIEAMLAGLPVVANAVGGVPEIVEHGKTGFLLGGFDAAEAAGVLGRLIREKELRRTMGENGRAAALAGFSLDGMVDGYRRLYELQEEKEIQGMKECPLTRAS